LRQRAWQVLEPHYLARLAGLVEMFGAARARELGTDDVEEAAGSAAGGRVATVLIQAEREDAELDDRLDGRRGGAPERRPGGRGPRGGHAHPHRHRRHLPLLMPDRLLVAEIEETTRRRLVTAAADTLLPALAKLLSDTPVSLVVVCTREQKMAGIVTKTDVVRTIAQQPGAVGWLRAEDAMTREVVACRPSDRLEQALQVMREHSLVHIPIVDGEARPVGVMEARDVLRALMGQASQEVSLMRDYIMGVGYR
jgi:CBS domain-containing protein